jgi:large subunit ribosomal protein L6
MKKDMEEIIEIPEGIEVSIEPKRIGLKKGQEGVYREYFGFKINKEGNLLKLGAKKATKKEKKLIKTIKAHIKNIIRGFDKKFSYKLKICSVHFPMSVAVDKTKKEVLIKNFLGEVKPRIAKILDGVDVKVDKDVITVESYETEAAGQTSANIERAVRINNRDRRVFQDGIFITDKPEY